MPPPVAQVIGGIAYLFYVCWKLTIVVLGIVPVVAIAARYVARFNIPAQALIQYCTISSGLSLVQCLWPIPAKPEQAHSQGCGRGNGRGGRNHRKHSDGPGLRSRRSHGGAVWREGVSSTHSTHIAAPSTLPGVAATVHSLIFIACLGVFSDC